MRSNLPSLLPLALAAMMVLAVPAFAQDDKPTEPAQDEPTYGDCGGEVCAYGAPDCIECSGPVSDGDQPVGDTDAIPARGPDGCEDCRGDDAQPEAGQTKDAPGLGMLATVAVMGLVLVLANRTSA